MLAALRDDLRTPTRWPALDGMRGVALWTVIGYHAYRLILAGPANLDVDVPVVAWPFGLAKFAIDVFFVLSGFLVVASWQSLRRRSSTTAEAARGYAGRRALRVLPAWWASLVVFVPLVAPQLLAPDRLGDLLLFATAQQYLVPGLASELNTPSWSLTVELQFYVVAPLLAWALARLGRWPVAAGALALSVAWWLALRHHVPLPASSLPGRIDQFALGAVAALVVADHERGVRSRVVRLARRPWVAAACLLTLVALGTKHGSTLGVTKGTVLDALLHPIAGVLITVLLVGLLTGGRRTVLDAPFPRACGLVSYSAYLWHYPLLLAVLGWTGHRGAGRLDLSAAAVLAAYLAVLAVIAVVSYALVERPFLHRKVVPGPPQPVPPAVSAPAAPVLTGR